MIRAVVTDIEGTTTRISFVKDVLFPYARERMAAWVRAHPDAPEVAATQVLAGLEGRGLDDVIAVLIAWIDADRKATPLKAIQGQIWEEGYATGRLVSHVYPDVPAALERWKAAGRVLAVYSSGSVLAQQLLFGHTERGDLRPYFSAWFDTTSGAKGDPGSYQRIAAALGFAPGEVLFLSDMQAEVDAARAAGMQACIIDREVGSFESIE